MWNSVKGLITKLTISRFHQNGVQKHKVAMIWHVQGTVCITASYTCKSWYGVLNMYCIRFLRCLVSSHVSKGRFCSWLFLFSKTSLCSKEMTCNWDCVGCTVSGNQLMDPTGCWFGEGERRREASCCDMVVTPDPLLLATNWFTEINQSLLWCRSITTAFHYFTTGLGAFRMLHLSFYFGLEMLMEK